VLSADVVRRASPVVAGAVVAALVIVVSACSGATADRAPAPPAPMVAVDHRRFSLTWEGDDICVHGAYPTLPACLAVDVRSTEPVLSALLQPLDAGADLLLVVTRPDVALDGLGPRVIRTMTAPGAGDHELTVSVAVRAARTPKVCAVVQVGGGRAALVVHRAVAVAADRPAEGAEGGC
jgi:hypothetical protein